MPKANSQKQIATKSMKILFIGDIIGEPGRRATKKALPKLKKKLKIDFVIANGEHLSERVGLEIEYVKEMQRAGIDFFTTGNHVWRKKDFENHIGKKEIPVIRPANFEEKLPGEGYRLVETPFGKILIVNLLGQEGFSEAICSPFEKIDDILSEVTGYKYSIVDFHAEMSSEKVAMGQYLNGRVTALLGTHIHVPTADNRILSMGTAFVSDVGMTGPINSVLGVKSEIIIKRFKVGLPQKFEIADGDCSFNSVIIETGSKGKAKKIERIDFNVALNDR